MKALFMGLLFLSLLLAIQSETTIKLCGREFVRAVVFACGGSRWRRQLADFSKELLDANENYISKKSESQSNEFIQYNSESETNLHSSQQKSVHKRNEDVMRLTITCCTIGCSTSSIGSLC